MISVNLTTASYPSGKNWSHKVRTQQVIIETSWRCGGEPVVQGSAWWHRHSKEWSERFLSRPCVLYFPAFRILQQQERREHKFPCHEIFRVGKFLRSSIDKLNIFRFWAIHKLPRNRHIRNIGKYVFLLDFFAGNGKLLLIWRSIIDWFVFTLQFLLRLGEWNVKIALESR